MKFLKILINPIVLLSLIILILVISIQSSLSKSSKEISILLTKKNSVYLSGEVNDGSVASIMDQIIKLKEKDSKAPIYLSLNSQGGSISAGMKLISFLNSQENVHTIVFFAASMASGIAELNKGNRYFVEDAIYMFHRARIGLSGQVEDGELESELALYKKIVRSLEQKMADRIGISLKEYKSNVKDEWWLFGDEASEKGVGDLRVKVKCDKELLKSSHVEVIDTFFGNVKVVVKDCPLLI